MSDLVERIKCASLLELWHMHRKIIAEILSLRAEVKSARLAALREALRVAHEVMRLSASAGATAAVVGAKCVFEDIGKLIAREEADAK